MKCAGDSGDPLLAALLRAVSMGDRQREIETIVESVAQPLAGRILSSYVRAERIIQPEDQDDINSTVMLRVVVRLNRLVESPAESIDNFENYVAALTYNSIHDFIRGRFPERTRLKNRLRYLAGHDDRLAIWLTRQGPACGLFAWKGRVPSPGDADLQIDTTPPMFDRDHPADAAVAILSGIGYPVTLNALCDLAAKLWNVRDELPDAQAVVADPEPSPLAAVERREFLRKLWKEVVLLRPLQRRALLLNLRDGDAVNVLSFFVLTGIATFDDVAGAIGLSPESLAEIWQELPLEDSRIGESMNVTRQQVINLRKAARARLARRLLSETAK